MELRSKLIVLEGLDGSGKSTQFDKLTAYLEENGVKLKAISFPDYEDPSSTLVQMYLHGEIAGSAEAVNAYAASSFYAADRYISYKKYWEKDYADGTLILAARYVTSNCIYQMTKLPEAEWENYLKWLDDYEYEKLGLPRPDQVIFLDMPVEVSQKLLSNRYEGDESKKDIHEKNVEYLHTCRRAAQFTAKMQGWEMIECSENGEPLSIDTIFERLLEKIK
ncbi:deoxynucleoside kinase [Ruminococcus sp.]|uniref:dTMP kinase n=1 Tax=Ruminococcus sp. TaxID=41978 RepID=UPI0025D12170|nr:deoxynucleoside kinase [Ruminococcus sp.]MBQ8965230.1 deoxynucleoside kinase [Ruminococcus sp.]